MGLLPPVVAELVAKTDGFRSELSRARGDMNKTAASGSSSFKTLAKVGGAALAGLGGIALVVGEQSIKAADTFELAEAKLTTALKNTGNETADYKKKMASAADAGTNFGFKVTDTTTTLAAMTTGLGSAKKALDLLPLAQNIAAATGRDLADTGLLVTKAAEGQTKALKALGIDLPIASTNAAKLVTAQTAVKNAEYAVALVEQKVHDGRLKGPAAADALAAANRNLTAKQQAVTAAQQAGSQITDALSAKYKGSASAAAQTFAGKQAIVSAKFDEVKVRVGLAIEGGLVKLVDWYNKSGSPMMARFDSGLHRWATDLGHVVHALQDVISAGETAAKFVSTIFGGGSSTGGSISNPNPQHPVPGAPPQPKTKSSPVYGQGGLLGPPSRPKPKPKGKAHAAGGPVSAGIAYPVGELGEELFVPGQSGTIIPNGGGVMHVTINVDARGAVGLDKHAVARWIHEGMNTTAQSGKFSPAVRKAMAL